MAFPTQLVTLTCLTLLAVLLIAMAADKDSTASDHIDCGESSQNIDDSGRTWDGDADYKFAPSVKGVAATAHFNDLHHIIPWRTARIFTSNYTYSFLVSPDRMFLRLYFCPGEYYDDDGDYAISNAFFGVTTGNLVLLNDFNVSQTAQDISFVYLVREFSVNVSSGSLDLTFAPSAHRNGSYAFVSGIEIVPINRSEWFLCICEWH
ncbi:Receptor-like protein kinase FERONIA [Hordeum vulgare]|uniref:receptor-like protein kinase FERONIA n=1 Tax=Hordeum vulgare subsp. vulgare TaxID=112509 RepID=UPI001D1A55A3|nr:receptor-like protein kinase FERONIA [Hordeum vulgare subsp. vulgare]KAE8776217.1 Receptor-like protein kinase FERONIA [Hordeum vulgare]